MDLAAKVWAVPAERMKAKKEHRVPPSVAAMGVLRAVEPLRSGPDAFLFPGPGKSGSLSDVALSRALHLAAGTSDVTVHGLRSRFRDWVAGATDYLRDAVEMALAHSTGDRVGAAYRRGDLPAKRQEMMEA